MTITNGIVSVEDGVKSATEYAPARKVRVELTFDVAEGADARKSLDAVSLLVNSKVRELLHQAPETVIHRAEAALVAAEPPAQDAGVNDPADVNAKIAAAVKASAAKKVTNRAKHEEEVAVDADPAGIGDIEPEASVVAEIEVEAEVAEITDAQLHEAIQKCNGRINNPAAIKARIAEDREDPTKPFSASMIAQTKRARFIADLAALIA